MSPQMQRTAALLAETVSASIVWKTGPFVSFLLLPIPVLFLCCLLQHVVLFSTLLFGLLLLILAHTALLSHAYLFVPATAAATAS